MKFERKLPYTIHIESSANGGFIVRAGCCTLAYTDPVNLITDLEIYLRDPKAVERTYHELDDTPHVAQPDRVQPDSPRPIATSAPLGGRY